MAKKVAATRGRKPMKAATKAKATKATTKKVARKVSAPKAASLNLPSSAIATKQTKAQIYTEIADLTQLSKPEVKKVISALKNVVERHVKTKGSGEITLPELGVKIRRVQKKATKARMGRNPLTGEEIKIKAKPARKSIKATALKALKELV